LDVFLCPNFSLSCSTLQFTNIKCGEREDKKKKILKIKKNPNTFSCISRKQNSAITPLSDQWPGN
jgi:hypothetical protein